MRCHRKRSPSACCPSQAEWLGVIPLVKAGSVCHCKTDSLEEGNTSSVININDQKMIVAKAWREGCSLAGEVPAFMAHWLSSLFLTLLELHKAGLCDYVQQWDFTARIYPLPLLPGCTKEEQDIPHCLRNMLSGELRSTGRWNTPLGDAHHLLMAPWHMAFYLHLEAEKLGTEMPPELHVWYDHSCFNFLDMEQNFMWLKGRLKTRQKHKCFSEAQPELDCPWKHAANTKHVFYEIPVNCA